MNKIKFFVILLVFQLAAFIVPMTLVALNLPLIGIVPVTNLGIITISVATVVVAAGCSFLSNLAIDFLAAQKSGTHSPKPPIPASYLFYLFLDAQDCDVLVGDLEERYKLILKKFGKDRADFWYWKQALWSVAPILWAWAKKGMKAASGLTALVELYRKMSK